MNLANLRKNREKYIAEMVEMPDKKLSRNLDLVRIQMEQAYKSRNDLALETLYEAESQIVEARRTKFDLEWNRYSARNT